MASTNEEIGKSIVQLAHRYHDPRELYSAVRKEHPDATKKDIALAALATMIAKVASGSAVASSPRRPAKGKRAAEQAHH